MRILKVEPGDVPYEKDIPNELACIQEEVGGGYAKRSISGKGLCCAATKKPS